LVTLFTIIFVTIIATLVKRYALWKAQLGAKVADLEQYQASTSLPSTLKMIVLLRAFHWMSLLLVFTWSWYYLGSQAVSREYVFQVSSSYYNTRIFYQSTETPSIFQNLSSLTSPDVITANSIYNVNYNSATGTGASDIYGSAVIPMINQPSDSGFGAPGKGGWRSVPSSHSAQKKADTDVVYSSYIGVPIYGANSQWAGPGWIGNYRINASYIYANCSKLDVHPAENFPSGAIPTLPTAFNITNQTRDGYTILDVWNRASNSSIHSSCLLETHWVELQSSCDAVYCQVEKIRPTPGREIPSPSTPFTNLSVGQRFFEELVLAGGVPAPETVTDGVIYLNSGLEYSEGTWSNWYDSQSTAQSLSTGISQMFNTYLAASQPQDAYWYLEYEYMAQLVSGKVQNVTWPTGPIHGALYNPTYVLSIPWIVVDLVTCMILLGGALASFWLRTRTTAPDCFGYVSSMSMDHPDIHMPQGASTMSGVERARAMKGVKVKIAALGADGRSANVSLTMAERRLRKGSAKK
jgi:hypothetical protein